MRTASLLLALLVVCTAASLAHAQPAPTRAEALGIVLETLSAEDLDTLKANTGYRLGVQIVEVKAGSPGAAAGLKATDLLLAVGKIGVDSAEKAAAALQAATGQVDLGTLTIENGTFAAKIRALKIPAGAATATPAKPQDQAQGGNEALVNKQTQDPIEAYFDMMDFIRSQAWGRKVSTSDEERQRVALQLQATQLDARSASVLLQIPQGWAAVQSKWKSWNDAQKSKQRAEWYTQLLLPGNMYPGPANPQQFTAPQGLGVAFQYPGEWTGGWTEANGMPLVFLGPNGQQAQWEQVLDTPKSPPGALFALASITNDMKGLSYLQAAHYMAKLLIPTGLQNMKVIQELPIGDVGAVLAIVGKFPGQAEEKFYWMGVTKFGDSQVFAGRMGGSVKDAETLIPAFTYMLQTLQLSPPQAVAGGGSGSGAWDAAWSRVDVAICKNIWAPSGN